MQDFITNPPRYSMSGFNNIQTKNCHLHHSKNFAENHLFNTSTQKSIA